MIKSEKLFLMLRLCLLLDLLILGHNTQMLRLMKSEAEVKLLRESASLTARAFVKVKQFYFTIKKLIKAL